MSRKLKTLQDVVDWGLCIGCGACFYACDKGGVSLVNIESVGIRPQFSDACASCTDCLSICPGYSVDADQATRDLPKKSEADHEFGPALEIWEGHAADPEIHYKASSGGILSALSLYCLERENMESVLHAGMDKEMPWTNKTVLSRSRQDVVERTGSRYAPASPCQGLGQVEQSERPSVFIGKPCDTAAVGKLREQRPELSRKLGLVISFFCAGTPSTRGTLELADSFEVPLTSINEVRYRGEGWPGQFKILYDDRQRQESLSYEESWGKLTKHRPFRCNLCPDGLGRVADISCGDAWNEFNPKSNGNGSMGRSLVIVRTRRGREILHRAMKAGYVRLRPVGSQAVLDAQVNLLQRRRQLFGRLLAMALLRVPVTQFVGFSLFPSWWKLPLQVKLRSIFGTLRRLIQRRMWRRQKARF